MTDPIKHHGYGNALVFDLATWRGRISSDTLVPGFVGPFTVGLTHGYILYVWNGDAVPEISSYNEREYLPVANYLQSWRREKHPAAVAACVSRYRIVGDSALNTSFMLDVKDIEFFIRKTKDAGGELPRTPEISAEETRLEAGFRETSKSEALQVEMLYVTSELHAEVYARLAEPGTWTLVGADAGDRRYFSLTSPDVVTVLHALGLASAEFEAWTRANYEAFEASMCIGHKLDNSIRQAREQAEHRGEIPLGPREPWSNYNGFNWEGSDGTP